MKIVDDSNNVTIKSYGKYAEEYIKRDENSYIKSQAWQHLKSWLIKSLEDVNKKASIFEIGSGTGRDAIFLKNNDYSNIQVSDVVDGFIEVLKKKGLNPIKFDILKDEFPKKYDVIIATAVLLHFERENIGDILKKIFDALYQNGKFLVCVQIGDGSKWKDALTGGKRFFEFYNENDFLGILKSVGFSDLEVSYNDNKDEQKMWLEAVARKREQNG
jgi:SAM-dependent methyltransferase